MWLTIRRNRGEYRAVVSNDGTHWDPFGNVLIMPEQMADARAAIFAHNGRSNAPSVEARFDRVEEGSSFHNHPEGPADLTQFAGWRVISTAGVETSTRFDGECLVLDTSAGDGSRSIDFVKQAPQGDWTVDTRLDFLSLNGSTAGLTAIGPKSRFRVIRWDLDGGSITANISVRRVQPEDAEVRTTVTLRITCRADDWVRH